MHRKYRCFCCVIIITFFCLNSNISFANETEKKYIVEFTHDISLFNGEQGCMISNVLNESELQECIDAGIVEWYEEDYAVELLDGEQREQETEQYDKWDLEIIESNSSTEIGCYGQEVKVVVIDSGVVEHEDLTGNIQPGYNYIDDNTDVTDNIGHGTFVSGLIAAELNDVGIRGVAPKAQIVPLKCFDSGTTTTVSMIKKAIEDAVDLYDADVINMSFGLTQYSQTLERAIKKATDSGVIVVAAVGNKGTDVLYYPAAFENVIGVGSVDSDCEKSSFSQVNASVDIVSPGEGVLSTTNTNGYGTKNGTSFSTPIVSGCIAVMMNMQEELTITDVLKIFEETSIDKGEEGLDTSYGYGVVNIKRIRDFMLQDVEYFISPIDITENASSVVIYNNTDGKLEGTLFVNNYHKNALRDFEYTDIEIEPQKVIKVSSKIYKDKIKCYIWRNIKDISVIGMFREREAN